MRPPKKSVRQKKKDFCLSTCFIAQLKTHATHALKNLSALPSEILRELVTLQKSMAIDFLGTFWKEEHCNALVKEHHTSNGGAVTEKKVQEVKQPTVSL